MLERATEGHLQIPNVSGLTTITSASASTVWVNDAVVALGNALGQDGTPVAAEGVISRAIATVHIGEHGLLGVQVAGAYGSASNGGAQVVGVQSGSAAAAAGIVAGDAIVTIDGHPISSVSDLNDAMGSTHPGDKITVGWQDSAGQSHLGTVTLATGAA